MKYYSKTFFFAALILTAGCNSKTTEENNSLPVGNQENAILPAAQAMSMNPDSSQTITAPQPQATPAVAGATGMNPPHGEPGHRCDIAVGAPLSSPPATPPNAPNAPTTVAPQGTPPTVASPNIPAPAINSSSGVITPKQIPPPGSIPPPTQPGTSVKTLPGMNPPHGEPGHDCTIAVGAPLKKQ